MWERQTSTVTTPCNRSKQRNYHTSTLEYERIMSTPTDLDKAFELIKKGNAFEKSGNHWGAADSYGHAMVLLQQLADTSPSTPSDEEHVKILQLYKNKSREYRKCARECLIKALQFEKETDSESKELPLAAMVSDQEAGRRANIFAMLYSKAVEENVDVGHKTSKLEERLMELNASLPSGFKTDSERLAGINRGLRRLGLSLYSSSDDHLSSSIEVHVPQSEDEQVAQIIAQAKDEVKYTKPKESKDEPSAASADLCVDTSDSDEDDSVDLEDIDDEAVLKNRKAIGRKVVKAQVKLAELIALLNTNPEVSDDIGGDEEDGENDDSKEKNAGFDLEYGRETLTAARNYLDKALKVWSENS